MVRLLVFPVLAALLSALLGGCSGCESASADCTTQARFEERVYNGYSRVAAARVGAELGQADLAACDDTGCRARGSYFPEDADQVTVFEIDGRSPEDVLAQEYADDRYALLLSEELPPDEREALARELARK